MGNGAYRFGSFLLEPRERLLLCEGRPVLLSPKLFDVLLLLVRRAEHLVSKQELRETIWPSQHVSETSLTNTIVSLRKIVGKSGIETVSKYGYRFALQVTGEPGVERATYERFLRGKSLLNQRSLEGARLARDLFYTCLAERPEFAQGWAWLGRCCWFIGKFGEDDRQSVELAGAAFQRAFLLEPDLASAHQFFTTFQVDTGHSREALERLLERVDQQPLEPEHHAGLVQVYRYRGLLAESIEAHAHATDLDPSLHTSVAHTHFLAGAYAAAIDRYSGRGTFYLDAAAWAALGYEERAVELLRARLHAAPLSPAMSGLMRSLLLLLEGRTNECTAMMAGLADHCEPEILVYLARHQARLAQADAAASLLERALLSGFVCAPETFAADPWLCPVQAHPAISRIRQQAEQQVQEARFNRRTRSAHDDLRRP